jgi:flagellar hook-associated protein 1
MGTISSALHVIAGALDADQAALGVVANNVANANTPGYTEESPTWRQNAPVTLNGVQIGTGVTETGFSSKRDRVLLQRLNQQQQLSTSSSTRLAALNQVQALFAPSSGSTTSAAGEIGSDITGFFNSFSSLESDPSNNALRAQVLSSASVLAGDLSGAASSLNAQRSSLDQQAAAITGQVNALTTSIAHLNLAIQSAAPNGDAGALEDQRQQALSQLSQLIGINQVTTEDNGLSVTTVSGQLLVSQGQSYALTAGKVGGDTQFFVGGQNIAQPDVSAIGGQLGGYLTARDQDIPSVLNSLDQLAYGISTAVNAANNAGTDLAGVQGTGTNAAGVTGTGTTPLYIFNQPAAGAVAGSAAAMTVVMTDPGQITAAGLGNGTGDNSNAVTMAGLAQQGMVTGQTPINFYSNFVSTLGATVSEVQAESTAGSASVTQLQSQSQALSSVNLNDQASALSLLETSYQAASQVFNILNTVMASALNLGMQSTVA